MTGTRLFLDTNVWIDYFQTKGVESRDIVEDVGNTLFMSSLSLHEFKKKLIKNGAGKKVIQKVIGFMKEKSFIVDIDETISEKSAEDSLKHKLHTIDALIYRSALENKATLVTMDYDFHRLPNVEIVKQK
jgi:predicted nucleic acid-binding protein